MQLFDRAGKRLLLNDNGRLLLPKALALLDNAMDIERMSTGQGDVPPPIRIGASTTVGNYVLPRILPRYLSHWYEEGAVDWHSTVTIGNTAEICRLVAEFELDIGLIEGPNHEPELDALPWLSDELLMVASPAKLAQWSSGAGGLVPVDVLRDEVWLLREMGSGTREAVDLALLPHLHAYRRSIELGNSEAIKHAVSEGLGVACLSHWVVADMLYTRQLERIETTVPRIMRQCHIVLHRQKRATLGLEKFMAHLNERATMEPLHPTGPSNLPSSLPG